MSKKLPLFTKFIICLLIVLLQVSAIIAQDLPPELLEQLNQMTPAQKAAVLAQFKKMTPAQRQAMIDQMMKLDKSQLDKLKDTVPKGRMVYNITRSWKQKLVSSSGVAIPNQVANTFVNEGGVTIVFAISDQIACINSEGEEIPYTDWWVLFADNAYQPGMFITDQSEKTADVRISGSMKRWLQNTCTKTIEELSPGFGGLRADFKSFLHMTPRTFTVMAGKDDVAKNKYLDQLKKARMDFLKNAPKYYKAVKEYQQKPKFKFIKIPDVDVGGIVPRAPAGASNDTATIVADGIGNAAKALNVWGKVSNPRETIASYSREYAVKGLSSVVAPMAAAAASSAHEANIIQSELPRFLANPTDYFVEKSIANVVGQVAAVNKMYADNGDPTARQIQKDATKRMKFQGQEYEYTDADYIAALALDAYDQEIKRLEKEKELEKQLPPSAGKGLIWGPGLYEPLRVWAPNLGTLVAGSYAKDGQDPFKDPQIIKMMEERRKGGDTLPDVETLDQYTKPDFAGFLWSKKMVTKQKVEVPKVHIIMMFGSPEATFEPTTLNTTIFDPPFANNDDDDDPDKKPKCRYVIATTGSDSNKGTDEEPFATLQKALDRVEVCRGGNQSGAIFIKNGVYRQSAEKTWVGSPTVSALEIKGESREGVIFTSAEVSNSTWQTSASGFTADMPLHQNQLSWTPTNNIDTNPPPVVAVNGQRMIYIPLAKNLPAPGTYKITGNQINVRPQATVGDLNSANVEVGVRPFALKLIGAKNVTVSNMSFHYFQTIGNSTPGLVTTGSQVTIQGVNYQ